MQWRTAGGDALLRSKTFESPNSPAGALSVAIGVANNAYVKPGDAGRGRRNLTGQAQANGSSLGGWDYAFARFYACD